MGYTVNAGCNNCGNGWKVDIPEGTDRDTWEQTAKCPKCKTSGHVWTALIS